MTTSTEFEQLPLFPDIQSGHVVHVEDGGMLGLTVTCHHCPFMAVGVRNPKDLLAIIDGHSGPIASD